MSDPGPSHWLVRSFSDDLSQERPGDALSRGLAAKVVHDGHNESRLAALRDQWNLFLVEGREMAIQSAHSGIVPHYTEMQRQVRS